eukprot:14357031-Alexandrium_andersonii.AAC.1
MHRRTRAHAQVSGGPRGTTTKGQNRFQRSQRAASALSAAGALSAASRAPSPGGGMHSARKSVHRRT